MINAQRLRALRLDRGLSQRKLAASAGVDALTIKRIEAGADPGDLTLRVLTKMADALGVQPGALLQDVRGRMRMLTLAPACAIGAALAAGGRSTRTGLARSANLPAPRWTTRCSISPADWRRSASPSPSTATRSGWPPRPQAPAPANATDPSTSTRHASSDASTEARTSAAPLPVSNGR